MHKINLLVFIVAVLIFSGFGCQQVNQPSVQSGVQINSPTTLPTTQPAVQTNPSEKNIPPVTQAKTYIVQISNFTFNQNVLNIKVGDTVRWENKDSVPHALAADKFSSNPLSKGDTFSYTFNETGEFDYHCSIHPSMTAKIVVK